MYYTIFTEKYQPKYTKEYKEIPKPVLSVIDDSDISFVSPEIFKDAEETPSKNNIETTVIPFKEDIKYASSGKMSKQAFKDLLLPLYERELKSKGLNPAFAKSIVAQDALETNWGASLAGKNNFGGIKGKTGTQRST